MLGFPLVGVLFAVNDLSIAAIGKGTWFLFAILFLFISIYTFNAYSGRNPDSENPRLVSVRQGEERKFLAITALFLVLSSLALWVLDIALMVLGLISFLLWAFYSYPEIGLKNRPIAGTLVHFVSQNIHFQMGYLVLAAVSTRSLLVGVFFALLFSGGHIQHELIDYEADKKATIRTNAVEFGREKALAIELAIFLAAAIYWLFLFGQGILTPYEFYPFAAASALQLITLLVLWRRIADDQRYSLLNRSLYRLYFLLAGLAFMLMIIACYV